MPADTAAATSPLFECVDLAIEIDPDWSEDEAEEDSMQLPGCLASRRLSLASQTTAASDVASTSLKDFLDGSFELGDVVQVKVPRRLSHILNEELSLPFDEGMASKQLERSSSWDMPQHDPLMDELDIPTAPDREMHEVHLEDLNHFLKCPGALEQCVKRKLKELKASNPGPWLPPCLDHLAYVVFALFVFLFLCR